MEISSSAPSIDLTSTLQNGDAFSSGSVTGTGDSGAAFINNTLGSQVDTQSQAIGAGITPEDTEQLSSAAETAFASVFFSLLQNILSEAQNNSGS